MSKNKKGWIIGLTSAALVAVAFGGGMLTHSAVSDKTYTEAEYQQHGEQQKEEGYENGYNETQEIIADLTEIVDLLAGGVRVYSTYGNIEFISSRNESIEGLWTHNTETGEYKKIISSGTRFNCTNCSDDNALVFIQGEMNSTTRVGYVYNLEIDQGVMLSNTNNWAVRQIVENSHLLICTAGLYDNETVDVVDEGIYLVNGDTLEIKKIVDFGSKWLCIGYTNSVGNLAFYFSYSTDEYTGLYSFDTVTEEVSILSTQGYNYQYINTLADKQVITCSLGLVEIKDDAIVNVLISNETGADYNYYEIQSNNMVLDNFNNLYRYNTETETFKQIDFGVSSATDMSANSGVYYILNNEESKFVIYSVSEDEVFTVNLEENMRFHGGVIDYNFGDEGNYITLYGLPNSESGAFKPYHIDLDAGTIEEVLE